MTKQEALGLAVDAVVFCTVRQVAGWHTVLEVRRRDGYMRVSRGWKGTPSAKAWCPPYNFTVDGPPEWWRPGVPR
jgi:hypothetical protein